MKNWNYINGAEVGNETKINPVTPAQKPGTKPQSNPNSSTKKNLKKEMTDKNGRTFREVLEEVKKTGNKYNIKPMSYKADAYRYGKELAEQDFKNFKYSNTSTLETIYRNNTSGEDYEQYGFLDFKKGYYDTYQQMDKKVGNSTEKLFYGLKDDAEKEEEKSDEALDELKKTENEKAISSTFNINDYGVEVGQWSWDWRGKAPDENKQKEIERKIKSYVQQINKNVPAGDNDERDAVFSQLDKFVRAQGLNKKVGNADEANDKFAYVMREFDEGKLKTPDGKVVTDPAQAKAIAYSESKKTENGLARARNAMNPVIYKGYTIRYRPNTGKYYISSGPNDTYVAKFAYKEYSSEQDAKDAIDGSR